MLARECTARGTTVSSSSIRHYLHGRRSAPPARTVFELSSIFGVDPRYFWDAATAHNIQTQPADQRRSGT